MPWMVTLFGIVVVPLGAISIYFIIIQPIMIGTYCTICLMAAAAMLIMIPYSLDELVAMGQFLVLNTRRGRPFWRSFFRGDALPGGSKDSHPGFDAPLAAIGGSAARGVTVPWTLAISVLIGFSCSPGSFWNVPPLADSDHLVGALVITVSVIAMAEVARPLLSQCRVRCLANCGSMADGWRRQYCGQHSRYDPRSASDCTEPAKRASERRTLRKLGPVRCLADRHGDGGANAIGW